MKLGIIQMLVTENKDMNLKKAEKKIYDLINKKADIILLPECFNSPYGINYFKKNAEYLPLNDDNSLYNIKTHLMFKNISNKYPNIYIFGGSIPEIDEEKIYNTCPVYHNGKLINKYRKIHLYEIALKDHKFREADVLSNGNNPIIIETKWGNIGIGICYDLRFPKLAEYYRKNNCKMILYPGAFNLITGQKHWELLNKSRALDNMLFIASCSVARNNEADFKAWGHSMIVNPNSEIINKLYENEDSILQTINFNEIDEIRNNIPCFKNQVIINM